MKTGDRVGDAVLYPIGVPFVGEQRGYESHPALALEIKAALLAAVDVQEVADRADRESRLPVDPLVDLDLSLVARTETAFKIGHTLLGGRFVIDDVQITRIAVLPKIVDGPKDSGSGRRVRDAQALEVTAPDLKVGVRKRPHMKLVRVPHRMRAVCAADRIEFVFEQGISGHRQRQWNPRELFEALPAVQIKTARALEKFLERRA